MMFYFFVFIFIFCSSVLAEEGLKDIRPPVPLPENFFWLFIVLGLLFLAGIIFLVRYYLSKKPAMKKKEIPKKPWEIAFEQLNALLKKDFIATGKIKEFYVELGHIVRHYIEERYALKAPEMTTPEFLEHIKRESPLQAEHKILLKDFLHCCDMVKFAKYGPTEKEVQDSIFSAKKFIEETIIKEDI